MILFFLTSSGNVTSNKKQNCTRLNTIFNSLEDIVNSLLIITPELLAEMKVRKLDNTKLRIKIMAIHCATSEILIRRIYRFYLHTPLTYQALKKRLKRRLHAGQSE